MLQFILHGVGDYLLQTDKQAMGKKNIGLYGIKQCFLHCLTYSLPFFIIGSWKAVIIIFITHYAIDRTNIVAWFIAKKNGVDNIKSFGFEEKKPFAIAVWLLFITDNIFHIICNYIALYYL